MRVSGKSRVLGLIGDPVEHTSSPDIHNEISKIISKDDFLNTIYVPFRLPSERVGDGIRGAFALNIQGLNVTVPHKQAVIPFLEDIDERAEKIGAVNTLVRAENGFKGYNTDAEGFKRELDFYGISIKGKDCVVLGAGGAAKAVAYILLEEGANTVFILNRSLENAKKLALELNGAFGGSRCRAALISEYDNLPGRDYVAIQCTSVGLSNPEKCIIEDDAFYKKLSAGVDIVYKPYVTKFMKLCHKNGIKAYNGLLMLLYQAVAAYELFCGVKIDKAVVERVYRLVSGQNGIYRPLILTGYMGSGKSTVAAKLGELTGITVLDTDRMIEEREGRTISEIFAADGEEYFRNLETELIRSLAETEEYGEKPFIISTGGGMPVREENRSLLKRLGTVIYLRAEAKTLFERLKDSENRPLLSGGELMDKIVSMLEMRGPLYEDGAAVILDTDNKSLSEVLEELGCFVNF